MKSRHRTYMKIAYLGQVQLAKKDGVVKKILAQLHHWRDQGHSSRFFALNPSKSLAEGLEDNFESVHEGSLLKRFGQTQKLAQKITDWKPDLIYFRFGLYYPAQESLMKRFPTVTELNTDDKSEFKKSMPAKTWYYHRLTRGRTLSSARALICVTDEISVSVASFRKPTHTIANGVELAAYPTFPPPSNSRPKIAFIGSPYPWHGVEKLNYLAAQLPGWDFDIIGYGAQDAPNNVTYHGYLERGQYEAILARSDMAVSTLSLYENNMEEACPLKTREYLAYGLPIVTAYQDTDFPEGAAFILRLPNAPANVADNVPKIEAFLHQWKGKRVPRAAIQHLDLSHKEAQRLALFKSVVERNKISL